MHLFSPQVTGQSKSHPSSMCQRCLCLQRCAVTTYELWWTWPHTQGSSLGSLPSHWDCGSTGYSPNCGPAQAHTGPSLGYSSGHSLCWSQLWIFRAPPTWALLWWLTSPSRKTWVSVMIENEAQEWAGHYSRVLIKHDVGMSSQKLHGLGCGDWVWEADSVACWWWAGPGGWEEGRSDQKSADTKKLRAKAVYPLIRSRSPFVQPSAHPLQDRPEISVTLYLIARARCQRFLHCFPIFS